MKIIISLCAFLLTCSLVQAAEFATGATERNQEETYLTLGNTTHNSPRDIKILGIRQYGYGYGQLELGHTWNVRGKNNGGVILFSTLNPKDENGAGAFVGVEAVTGEFKVGSQKDTNKYLYTPGLTSGLELRALGLSLTPLVKIGPAVSNVDEVNSEVLTPTHSYHRTYGAYLSLPGTISIGYTNVLYKGDVSRESTNMILFNTVNMTIEDNPREKLFTISLDL